eukprot:evm.model.scf_468.9 EVM.evm.TU.scf_468.9   scf_468:57346-62247(-)
MDEAPDGAAVGCGADSIQVDLADDRVPVIVEVCLKETSVADVRDIDCAVRRFLDARTLHACDYRLSVPEDEHNFLHENAAEIRILGADEGVRRGTPLLPWQVNARIFIFQVRITFAYFVFSSWTSPLRHIPFVLQLNNEGPADDDEGDEGVAFFKEWILPSQEFHAMWDTLYYEDGIKRRLLNYAHTALLFSEQGVNSHIVSWNRVVLLHGPPGTGKTSMCKALAQRLSILFSHRYQHSQLVEVNAHSLFSKWFSESGKLVSKLFAKIQDLAEDNEALVFVLIDEIESLTAARKSAVSGSEPSDALRAVNALLTQLDALKRFPNVMVLTTSNVTEAIDVAFVDRADVKVT